MTLSLWVEEREDDRQVADVPPATRSIRVESSAGSRSRQRNYVRRLNPEVIYRETRGSAVRRFLSHHERPGRRGAADRRRRGRARMAHYIDRLRPRVAGQRTDRADRSAAARIGPE